MNTCAFDKDFMCEALREKSCEHCSFRKTEEELIEGRRKATMRINNLPKDKKNHIIRTYHKQGRCNG